MHHNCNFVRCVSYEQKTTLKIEQKKTEKTQKIFFKTCVFKKNFHKNIKMFFTFMHDTPNIVQWTEVKTVVSHIWRDKIIY